MSETPLQFFRRQQEKFRELAAERGVLPSVVAAEALRFLENEDPPIEDCIHAADLIRREFLREEGN